MAALSREKIFRVEQLHPASTVARIFGSRAYSPDRLLPGGLSEVRSRCWRLVQAGRSHSQRQTSPHPRGAEGCRWEVWPNRLAHIPSHLPFVAGRDWSANENTTEIDASRLDPGDDERLWQAMLSSMQEVNRKILEMVLKPLKASVWNQIFCDWESLEVDLKEWPIRISS